MLSACDFLANQKMRKIRALACDFLTASDFLGIYVVHGSCEIICDFLTAFDFLGKLYDVPLPFLCYWASGSSKKLGLGRSRALRWQLGRVTQREATTRQNNAVNVISLTPTRPNEKEKKNKECNYLCILLHAYSLTWLVLLKLDFYL